MSQVETPTNKNLINTEIVDELDTAKDMLQLDKFEKIAKHQEHRISMATITPASKRHRYLDCDGINDSNVDESNNDECQQKEHCTQFKQQYKQNTLILVEEAIENWQDDTDNMEIFDDMDWRRCEEGILSDNETESSDENRLPLLMNGKWWTSFEDVVDVAVIDEYD